MEKEFCTYNQALRLKALGFNEPCFSFYMGGFEELGRIKYVNPSNVAETNVLAPTFSQAFRWFRKNYELDSFVRKIIGTDGDKLYCYEIFKTVLSNSYTSHEEAELACLDKLLEIVETKSE